MEKKRRHSRSPPGDLLPAAVKKFVKEILADAVPQKVAPETSSRRRRWSSERYQRARRALGGTDARSRVNRIRTNNFVSSCVAPILGEDNLGDPRFIVTSSYFIVPPNIDTACT